MLVIYLCVRGIDVGHVFVCDWYRCWSYICVLGVSILFLSTNLIFAFRIICTVWYLVFCFSFLLF
jgi:hypothetical protein